MNGKTKMGKRAMPDGPGRPKDMMPPPMRKAMGLNVTPAIDKANKKVGRKVSRGK